MVRSLVIHATNPPNLLQIVITTGELGGSRLVLDEAKNRNGETQNRTLFENDLRSRMARPQATTATASHETERRHIRGGIRVSSGRNGRIPGLVCGDWDLSYQKAETNTKIV